MAIYRQQQRIENQRKRQVKHRYIAPRRVAQIPLYTGVVLITVALPRYRTADNTTAAAQKQSGNNDNDNSQRLSSLDILAHPGQKKADVAAGLFLITET
jgi:hypothetical protein